MDLEEIKNNLEKFLRDLGKEAKKGFFEDDKNYSTKKNKNDLLTEYDLKLNNEILNFLKENYPDISIVSEEAPKIVHNSEYSFVVDPIDGTRNFVRGIPLFFIGIALVKNNKTILSITYNPILDELFWAIKGRGAYLNNKRIKVSKRTLDLSDIQVRILPHSEIEKRIIIYLLGKAYQIKNDFCCHYEISGVASSRFDGMISKGSSSWDYCHYLLVEEAGGKVTDWEGKEFDISKDNIIISNGIIHKDLLKAVH